MWFQVQAQTGENGLVPVVRVRFVSFFGTFKSCVTLNPTRTVLGWICSDKKPQLQRQDYMETRN